jgi:hypothetical protein
MTKAQHTPLVTPQEIRKAAIAGAHLSDGQVANRVRMLNRIVHLAEQNVAMLDELRDAAASFREIAELPSTGPGAATSCRLAAAHIEAFLSRIGGAE